MSWLSCRSVIAVCARSHWRHLCLSLVSLSSPGPGGLLVAAQACVDLCGPVIWPRDGLCSAETWAFVTSQLFILGSWPFALGSAGAPGSCLDGTGNAPLTATLAKAGPAEGPLLGHGPHSPFCAVQDSQWAWTPRVTETLTSAGCPFETP